MIKTKTKIKSERVKRKLNMFKLQFKYGVKYGFMIGSCFGLITGSLEALKHKSFIIIPVHMLISGGTFAGIMSIGSIVRSEEVKNV